MRTRVPNPFESPELWESMTLVGSKGSTTIPGVATVDVEPGAPKIDEQEVPGSIGAVAYQIGWKLGRATVKAQLWRADQFDKLRAVLETYRRVPNAKVESIQALHPNLQLHGLTNVYLERIEAADYDPDEGYVITLELREFTPDMRDQRTRQQFAALRAAQEKAASGSGSGGAGSGGAGSSSGTGSKPPASTAQKANQTRPSQTSALVQGVIAGSSTARNLLGR